MTLPDATVERFLEEAIAFGPYATLSEALPLLDQGRPVYLELDGSWSCLAPRNAVGHAQSRRLIDLPLLAVPPIQRSTRISEVLARPHSIDWVPVVESGALLGQVRVSRIGKRLAGLRGQVAAVLGHDINNVLSVLQACLDLVRLGGDDTPEILEQAERALIHGRELSRRLHDWANPGDLRLGALAVGEVLDELIPWLRRATIPTELALDRVSELPSACGDRASFERIIVNLVLNACEAMNGGHVVVSVKAGESSVSVWVRDDGPGIPSDLLDQVFEAGTSSKGEQRGLGLAAVRRSADESGCQLTLERTGPDGTVFRIDLPLMA